ncbi:MAG: alcohol dehydrogenase catalytic domain-containing protein [Rhodobacter sp.]|nr:alcohol dehydrogenase catalytic domain-containing protein [Rhodobacter sp.]
MRAILCSKPQDDLSTTRLTEVDVKEPGPGEALVRVEAVSLNPVDWKLCAGVAPWWNEPHIVGLDAAGVIEAMGTEVTGWSVGERVVWHGNLGRDGVFAAPVPQ